MIYQPDLFKNISSYVEIGKRGGRAAEIRAQTMNKARAVIIEKQAHFCRDARQKE